jgi:hypothetical protein
MKMRREEKRDQMKCRYLRWVGIKPSVEREGNNRLALKRAVMCTGDETR